MIGCPRCSTSPTDFAKSSKLATDHVLRDGHQSVDSVDHDGLVRLIIGRLEPPSSAPAPSTVGGHRGT